MTPWPYYSHRETIKSCPNCNKPNAINEPGSAKLLELPILCYSCGATIIGLWDKIVALPEVRKEAVLLFSDALEKEIIVKAPPKKKAKKLMKCRFCDFHAKVKDMEDHLRIRHESKAEIFMENSRKDLENWQICLRSYERLMEA